MKKETNKKSLKKDEVLNVEGWFAVMVDRECPGYVDTEVISEGNFPMTLKINRKDFNSKGLESIAMSEGKSYVDILVDNEEDKKFAYVMLTFDNPEDYSKSITCQYDYLLNRVFFR